MHRCTCSTSSGCTVTPVFQFHSTSSTFLSPTVLQWSVPGPMESQNLSMYRHCNKRKQTRLSIKYPTTCTTNLPQGHGTSSQQEHGIFANALVPSFHVHISLGSLKKLLGCFDCLGLRHRFSSHRVSFNAKNVFGISHRTRVALLAHQHEQEERQQQEEEEVGINVVLVVLLLFGNVADIFVLR